MVREDKPLFARIPKHPAGDWWKIPCDAGFAPTKWESFENINKQTKDRNQASDHHCVWADVEV